MGSTRLPTVRCAVLGSRSADRPVHATDGPANAQWIRSRLRSAHEAVNGACRLAAANGPYVDDDEFRRLPGLERGEANAIRAEGGHS
jgi:hypothetical protein